MTSEATPPQSPNASKHRRQRRWLWIALALIVLSPVFFFLAFYAAVLWLPGDEVAAKFPSSTWIVDRNGQPLAAFVSSRDDWSFPLSYEEISPHLLNAIVAVEDGNFYSHHGVDWPAVGSAVWTDLTTFSTRRGASTLTMQLYRLQRPAARSFSSKLMQAIRASQMERRTGKREILVRYLNSAPFGGNLVGAGAASWRYFGKPCHSLSLGQAALLAGLPQSPTWFRPDRFPDRAKRRRDHVLERMVACGMITPSQQALAAAEPVDARWAPLPQFKQDAIRPSSSELAGHSADGLMPTLLHLANDRPGQTIHTTIDADIQRLTHDAATVALNRLAASHISAVAVVVLDTPTGQCLAAVSQVTGNSRDADSVDLTVRPHSSGSTLKPFIYAAAFDAGICTPRTMIADVPTAWGGYEPDNYDRVFRGTMPVAEALAQSRNIPAIAVLSKVGVENAIRVMGQAGLTRLTKTPERYGLSLAIGGAEVTPMELAAGYATLGRQGRYIPPLMTIDATDSPLSSSVRPRALQGAELADDLHQLLRQKQLRAQSCLSALYSLGDRERTRSVYPPAVALGPAWKTGTSSGHRDAWCAGVTPQRTVVVWLGNADGSGSDALVGQSAAAPLALRVLTLADSSQNGNGFAPPPDFKTTPEHPDRLVDRAGGGIVFLSPTNGQKIIRDAALPPNRQRIPLRGRTSGNSNTLWWFVDGKCIGQSDATQPCWWNPQQGSHEFRATDQTGHSASISIAVE